MSGRAKRGLAPLRREALAAHERKNTYKIGLWGEVLVMLRLLLRGYVIVAWRFKTNAGEVDVVAKRGKTIAAVEVKARSYKPTGEEITARQRARIENAMSLFLLKHSKYQQCNIRYDAALVSLPFGIDYRESAW